MRVRLAHETDREGFRAAARRLLGAGVAPDDVHWSVGDAPDLLGGDTDESLAVIGEAPVRVPAFFVELCTAVILHRDPQRFALLYRLLWRLAHEPALRHDPLDADLLAARAMEKAVHRDIHKMHAFLRFRQVHDGHDDPLHVAWFEPGHRIVEANADWFRRRFAAMRWVILTPDRCVAWDRHELTFGPGATRDRAPAADAGEQLWLTYYRSIFNPARLKLDMMRKEMPRRYWHNLPEAVLITPLVAEATQRTGEMVEAPGTTPRKRVVTFMPQQAASPAAGSLDALRFAVDQCRRCPLYAAATQAVPGVGPTRPALMFVGEQPGDQEDLQGRPFVGSAGQLLDEALAAAGIDRQAVFVTNAVRHFKFEPRGKRRIHKTPAQQEVLACRHWLDEEIALVRPHALVALGATAALSLLGRMVAVLSERGRWFSRADGIEVFVTVHPSSLLRLPPRDQPAALEKFVADLRLALHGPAHASKAHGEQSVT